MTLLASTVVSVVPPPVSLTLQPLSFEDSRIHERAALAARRFKQSEAELMEALIEVGEARLYLRMGFPSLFRYATEALGLSEAVAYCAISVARKAADVPLLRAAVGSGELGLSKAKKILSVLKADISPAEQGVWVEKALRLTSRRLERAVASENPNAAISERVVYKSARRIELTLGIDEEILLDLRQAQNVIATGRSKVIDLEGILAELVRFYLERKDPERRARRIIGKKGIVPKEQFPGTVRRLEPSSIAYGRMPLRAALEHQVRLRDRNTCQAAMPDGRPCGSRRWLEIHHRVPVSEGGENQLENLTMFCRAHHHAHHQGGRAVNQAPKSIRP